jgi:integrase
VPIPHSLILALRTARSESDWPRDTDLVFAGMMGEPINYANLRHRVLVPTGQEAGVPWVTFHAFRHTAASTLFDRGSNAKQVQRWLGHHSAAFTSRRTSTCSPTNSTRRSSCPKAAAGPPKPAEPRTLPRARNGGVEPQQPDARNPAEPVEGPGT